MSSRKNVASSIALKVVLTLLACLFLTEILLRVPAFFGTDLSVPERDPDRMHVLCVGDSFTEARGVKASSRYPAQLQGLLDETEPGSWATVNLGFTGETSSYVTERFPADLRRYEPEVVILWIGGNMNTSMLRPRGDGTLAGRVFRQLLGNLEIYRFARVWLDDRALEKRGRELETESAEKQGELTMDEIVQIFAKAEARERAFKLTTDEAERRSLLESDYRTLVEQAQDAGARIIFITYPADLDNHGRANEVMRSVASEYGIPVVSLWDVAQKVPAEDRLWLWGMHPSEPIYEALVRELVPLVVESPTGAEPPPEDAELR